MLKTTLLHPEILAALAANGHGSRVLITDGNYPHTTGSNFAAKRVFLNLAPDLLKATDVLAAVASAIPIEAAYVMRTASGEEPTIWGEFRALLPGLELSPIERFAFYENGRGTDVALVIATGETRIYANILLTIGVYIAPLAIV